MSIKDYYKVLGVHPAATPEKIKASYRKLVLQYHPDKTFGDKSAEAKFKEVQEAYEVLSNKFRKINYDYAYNQQKQSITTAAKAPAANGKQPLTPQAILQQLEAIKQSVERVKQKGKKIKQEALYNRLYALLNPDTITFLQSWSDLETNRRIIHHALQCCRFLSYHYVAPVSIRLAKLAGADNETIENIFAFTQKRKFWRHWDDYKKWVIPGVIILTFLVVLLLLVLL